MPVDSETFWITAGQAIGVVGGTLGATAVGALLLRNAVDAMEERESRIDPAAREADMEYIRQQQAVMQQQQSAGRTRLSAEEVLLQQQKQQQQQQQPPSK